MNDCNSKVSVLIPTISNSIPINTISSITTQECICCEIIILHNGVSNLSSEIIHGKEIYFGVNQILIRFIEIRNKGKGNALNIGIRIAKYDLICVLDADCILDENAFKLALVHFRDEKIIAVGGKIKVINSNRNIITYYQELEYIKTFNIFRYLLNQCNANYLISGAYGIFRKSDLLLVNGYDITSVGEDMELILHMQERLRCNVKRVIYDNDSICYTKVPYTLLHLFRQRDRWQRGLLDATSKHIKILFNPKYGLLGVLAMPYQVIFELLKPVFNLINILVFLSTITGFNKGVNLYILLILYLCYFIFEILLNIYAEYLEYDDWYICIKRIPKIMLLMFIGVALFIPLTIVRVWGMLSFHWRKQKW